MRNSMVSDSQDMAFLEIRIIEMEARETRLRGDSSRLEQIYKRFPPVIQSLDEMDRLQQCGDHPYYDSRRYE